MKALVEVCDCCGDHRAFAVVEGNDDWETCYNGAAFDAVGVEQRRCDGCGDCAWNARHIGWLDRTACPLDAVAVAIVAREAFLQMEPAEGVARHARNDRMRRFVAVKVGCVDNPEDEECDDEIL